MAGKGWIGNVSATASRVYFLLIILQIPLFRVPCRSGMCLTPIHVTSSQLIASEVFPVLAVKALLYPGAIASGLFTQKAIPSWSDLLDIYNLTSIKEAAATAVDLQRLEVSFFKCLLMALLLPSGLLELIFPFLAGSYFAVAGALVGILKPVRMSMLGTLLIIWGLVKEGLLGKLGNTDPARSVYVYPTMVIALICALSSIKYDLKKATKPPVRTIAKPLQSSSKSKLK